MLKLLKKYGFVPDKLVTDDLRSYGAAASDLGIADRHDRGRWCNNRVENSHQPTRRREREDPRVQERWVRAKISVHSCSSPQHLQRPAPSHLSKNTPSLQGLGDADMARNRRGGLNLTCQVICYVLYLAM
jgi:transposase-like protein